MRIWKLSLVTALGSLCALDCFAQTYTGNSLLSHINSSSNLEKAYALGYVAGAAAGISDTIEAQRQDFQKGRGVLPNFCVPAGVSNQQMTDIVKKYMLDNPSSRHEPADVLVYGALGDSFPCPPKR